MSRNFVPSTHSVATAAGLVSFGIFFAATALAQDPDPGIDPNCKTPDECFDESLCPGIAACIANFGAPVPLVDPETGEETYDFLDPAFKALNRALIRCFDNIMANSVADCVERICSETMLAEPMSPNFVGCTNLLNAMLTNCGADKESLCSDVIIPPDWYAPTYLEYCDQYAYLVFAQCIDEIPSPGARASEFIEEGTVYTGVLSTMYAYPHLGETRGGLVWVPMGLDGPSVSSVRIHFIEWVDGRYTAANVLEFTPDASGAIEADFDIANLQDISFQRTLGVIVEWQSGEEMIEAIAHRLPIAESGVPGDFDRDGKRNAADLSAFIDAYDHNAPRADRNHDGVVNSADLELFLTEYDGH